MKRTKLLVWLSRHFENPAIMCPNFRLLQECIETEQLVWKGEFDASFILKTVKGAAIFVIKSGS